MLYFHHNIGYTNTPQWSIICTLCSCFLITACCLPDIPHTTIHMKIWYFLKISSLTRKFTIFWYVTPHSAVEVLQWGHHEEHHRYIHLYYLDMQQVVKTRDAQIQASGCQKTKYCMVAPNIFSLIIASFSLICIHVYQFTCTKQKAPDKSGSYMTLKL